MRVTKSTLLSALLVAGVVGQGAYLTWTYFASSPADVPIVVRDSTGAVLRAPQVGERIPPLVGYTALGAEKHLLPVDGRALVLIALSASCRFCDEVMPYLRDSLSIPQGTDVFVISRDSIAVIEEYMARYDLALPIISFAALPRETREQTFVSRTPWAFVLSPDGRLVETSHASLLGAFLAPLHEASTITPASGE